LVPTKPNIPRTGTPLIQHIAEVTESSIPQCASTMMPYLPCRSLAVAPERLYHVALTAEEALL